MTEEFEKLPEVFKELTEEESKLLFETIEKYAENIIYSVEKSTKDNEAYQNLSPEAQEVIFKELVDDLKKQQIDRIYEIVTNNEEETKNTVELNFKGYPKKSLMHTTLLSRELPNLVKREEHEQLTLFTIDRELRRKDPEKRITGTITIDDVTDQNPAITPTDMFHYIGICRLYNADEVYFTPDMLVRASYSNSKKRVTDKQREEAINSIEKLRRSVIEIDVTEEYRLHNKIGRDESVTFNENMIYIKGVQLKHANGTISSGYKLLDQPVLDIHAFSLSQIDSIDNELVEVTGGKEDALLITYLASRMLAMKNPKNKMTNRIALETVYKNMDLPDPSRDKRKQVKQKIESRLDEWENKSEIKGYKFIKQANRWHAVDLFF